MDRPQLPLNALRAFEVAARQGSFTRAAIELCVTQAAISHQITALEKRLNVQLFERSPKGLRLTEEGKTLLPVMEDALDGISGVLDRFIDRQYFEVLNVGAVTTFAAGWLIEKLPRFRSANPHIDLRLSTNNNRVDLAGERLDMAIRFGDGGWAGEVRQLLFDAPISPLCCPLTASRLRQPADLLRETLLRSYRAGEWEAWFAFQGLVPPVIEGPRLDSSPAMAMLAAAGTGVAILPVCMFRNEMNSGRLVKPFELEISMGSYWLTHLSSRKPTMAMKRFAEWLRTEVGQRL
nr:LysR family transcriptional regulator [uncultured Cohaesibacter sp.]